MIPPIYTILPSIRVQGGGVYTSKNNADRAVFPYPIFEKLHFSQTFFCMLSFVSFPIRRQECLTFINLLPQPHAEQNKVYQNNDPKNAA